MAPLGYSKWDALQLSDDSDIETHPNVDTKSMIRWKQRDIHEKRELRKYKIHHLGLEKEMNASLLLRMNSLLSSLKTEDSGYLEREANRLRALVPDYDNPKKLKDGEQPSQDHMVLNLILQIRKAVKEGSAKGDVEELKEHIRRLEERQVAVDQEREQEEKEQKKHITSDDLHTGWNSKTMISSTPSAIPLSAKPAKKTAKKTETVIETLNSPSTSSAVVPSATSNAPGPDEDNDDDDEAAPITPSALAFSKLPKGNFEMAYKFISAHPDLLKPSLVDSLLVEAFENGMKGQDARARECVEKSLMLQYCHQLGRDGVALFFKRMLDRNPKSLEMFQADAKSTADRLIARARVVAEEKKNEPQGPGAEQIQLVPSQEGMNITFEVPDGPPPEKFEITGEGSENLDPEQVRLYLQHQWDIFTSFPPSFQTALSSKSLDAVNVCLGKMSVEEAEKVVKDLQDAGILSFEEGGIRDQTGSAAPSGAAAAAETGQPEAVGERETVEKEVDELD